MNYDPPAEVARAKVPVLILQGGMDLQITEADARALAAANTSAKLVFIPGANHVLKATTARDVNGQLPSYQDSSLPIVPAIVPAIARWIGSLKQP